MKKFAIFQIQLTDAEFDLVNEKGHDAVAKQKAKIDMEFDFKGEKIGELADHAFDNGYYTHVANIEADSLNAVFQIGNIGPEENIERLGRMSSVSVANIIVDDQGESFVVAPIGFVSLGVNQALAA